MFVKVILTLIFSFYAYSGDPVYQITDGGIFSVKVYPDTDEQNRLGLGEETYILYSFKKGLRKNYDHGTKKIETYSRLYMAIHFCSQNVCVNILDHRKQTPSLTANFYNLYDIIHSSAFDDFKTHSFISNALINTIRGAKSLYEVAMIVHSFGLARVVSSGVYGWATAKALGLSMARAFTHLSYHTTVFTTVSAITIFEGAIHPQNFWDSYYRRNPFSELNLLLEQNKDYLKSENFYKSKQNISTFNTLVRASDGSRANWNGRSYNRKYWRAQKKTMNFSLKKKEIVFKFYDLMKSSH